ncbi:MAG: hypothetical protein R3B84_11885 [Zavarzinella sp.]
MTDPRVPQYFCTAIDEAEASDESPLIERACFLDTSILLVPDMNGMLQYFNCKTGRITKQVSISSNPLTSIDISYTSGKFVSSAYDGTIFVFDVKDDSPERFCLSKLDSLEKYTPTSVEEQNRIQYDIYET